MVMAQGLFMLLKQQDPESVIDVAAPKWSQPLLARMPEVNHGISLPVRHGELALSVRFRQGRQLAGEGYDQAIVLPNSFKSALVPFWAKIPKRTGWKGEFRYGLLNDIRTLDKAKYPLMIERFAALAFKKNQPLPEVLPKPLLIADADNTHEAVSRFSLRRNRPVLGICPGAEFGAAKRWPQRHYTEVINACVARGWQVWIFGSEKDRELSANIRQMTLESVRQHTYNLAGKTELADAIDLLSLADAVVSNDSGLMHIAAALRRNLISVYGSSSPDFTPPLNDNRVMLRLGLECSPCFKRECPFGHLNCLEQLLPERVIQALEQLTGQLLHSDVL